MGIQTMHMVCIEKMRNNTGKYYKDITGTRARRHWNKTGEIVIQKATNWEWTTKRMGTHVTFCIEVRDLQWKGP